MSISTREEDEKIREVDADPSFFRTVLCFLLVFATHLLHQKAFLSVNAAEVTCYPSHLAGEMVRKNVMTPIFGREKSTKRWAVPSLFFARFSGMLVLSH